MKIKLMNKGQGIDVIDYSLSNLYSGVFERRIKPKKIIRQHIHTVFIK